MSIAISKKWLTSERWQHTAMGHPEIAEYYIEILDAISNPDVIYEGNNDAKITIKKLNETFTKFVVNLQRDKC